VSGAEERLANDPTSELWGEHRSRYRFAAERLQPGARVLDVACGAGFGLDILQRRVIGLDYDPVTLKHIRGHQLVRGDATCLPFQTGSFDNVVSFETLEHVRDAAALIAEVRRVLKPAGRLILSTPNKSFGPLERHTQNPFHIREFTAEELRELLRAQFAQVTLYGQRPSSHYRYVPYLMVEPTRTPDALLWKAQTRLPYGVKNRFALLTTGRPFYPSERDYCFEPERTDGAHALLAIAE